MSREFLRPLAAVLLPALAASAAAQELEGRTWTHDGLGIKMTIPPDYSLVPLQVDERWIVAKFLCDKTYISKDRDWNYEHRPLLRVIAFTEKAKKEGGVEVEELEDGSTFIGIGAVPYQGYRDYVKRHRSGFFFSREDEDDVAGEKCLQCEVDLHKREPKLHLYSAVFRREKFEVAIEFEVLEDRKDKLEASCRRAIESVRFFEPEAGAASAGDAAAALAEPGATSRLWTKARDAWANRPLAERAELRRSVEQARFQAVRDATPDDWQVEETKSFLVVSHADGRFTERMVEAADVFLAWCDKEFGDLSDEYVRRCVLRVCRDFDEYKAYHFDSSRSTGWSLFDDDHEIGTYRDGYHGTSGSDAWFLFDDILIHYLQEKDPYIVQYTPAWLTWALDDYVSGAIVRGRKLEFRVDDWVREQSRQMQREGRLPQLRDLLEMDEDTFWKKIRSDHDLGYATTQALRFVLVGPGKRDKAFKDFLQRYFKAAIATAERHDDDWKDTDHREAQSEEEEEQMAKERSDRAKERRKQLQAEINAEVFAGISDRQWERFQKAFEAFVKAGK